MALSLSGLACVMHYNGSCAANVKDMARQYDTDSVRVSAGPICHLRLGDGAHGNDGDDAEDGGGQRVGRIFDVVYILFISSDRIGCVKICAKIA